MRNSPKFSREVIERESIVAKIGCTGETLRKWGRQGERDRGVRPGPNDGRAAAHQGTRACGGRAAQDQRHTEAGQRVFRGERFHRRAQSSFRGRADLHSAARRFVGVSSSRSAPAQPGAPAGAGLRDAQAVLEVQRVVDQILQIHGIDRLRVVNSESSRGRQGSGHGLDRCPLYARPTRPAGSGQRAQGIGGPDPTPSGATPAQDAGPEAARQLSGFVGRGRRRTSPSRGRI